MNVTSSSCSAGTPSATSKPPALGKIKEDFESISKALQSGNVDDAKKAYAQLKKDAPEITSSDSPIGSKVQALGKALDSGDVDAAKQAMTDIKEAAGKGRPPGGKPPGGKPPGGAGGSGGASATKTYDKMDANKDGKVSDAEKAAYLEKHPEAAETKSSAQSKTPTANEISDLRQLLTRGDTEGDEE